MGTAIYKTLKYAQSEKMIIFFVSEWQIKKERVIIKSTDQSRWR